MKRILLGAVALVALVGAVNAQPVLNIPSPVGTEIVNAANSGPQLTSVYLRQLRDATGYVKAVPVTAFSLTFGAGVSVMQLTPAGTLATGTITMAASPVDGQHARIYSTQIVTALTLNAGAGQSINSAASALAANVAIEYIYSASNLTWDRIL